MKITDITTKISGIYKINFPNNKIYIGRSVDIKRRIKEHYIKKDNTPCQKALLYYFEKPSEIEFEIIFIQEKQDLNELKEKEIYYIELYKACDKDRGYNLLKGGEGADCGISNVASKITQKDLEDIVKRLQNGESNIDIGKIYNINADTIGKINNGKTYYNENLEYPLRKEKTKTDSFKNGNSFKREQYLKAISLIKKGKSITEISKEVNISTSTLYKINTGKHFICKELNDSFPLFNYGRKSARLSKKEIDNIKIDLLNPNLSTTDIAKKYQTSRDTVSDINQGKRYRDENIKYPIRNFYPNRGSKKPVSTILESEE